jgi:transcriptional regulator with XRE-family HTH domain
MNTFSNDTVRRLINQLVVARIANGISQLQVGKGCGLARNQIGRIENGHSAPMLESFCAWADMLGFKIILTPKNESVVSPEIDTVRTMIVRELYCISQNVKNLAEELGTPTDHPSVEALGLAIEHIAHQICRPSTPEPALPGDIDLIEQAWGIIANAGCGDWNTQTAQWKTAAEQWRSRWHQRLVNYYRHGTETKG